MSAEYNVYSVWFRVFLASLRNADIRNKEFFGSFTWAVLYVCIPFFFMWGYLSLRLESICPTFLCELFYNFLSPSFLKNVMGIFLMPPSIRCLSRYLLNHWAEFYQPCYITSPHGKGVQEQYYISVHLSPVYLSVTLSPPKPLGGIQPNLQHHFPSWFGCARATLFFHVSICPSVHHLSIYLLRYLLLNHWAEFSQTCYITYPHGKGVPE